MQPTKVEPPPVKGSPWRRPGSLHVRARKHTRHARRRTRRPAHPACSCAPGAPLRAASLYTPQPSPCCLSKPHAAVCVCVCVCLYACVSCVCVRGVAGLKKDADVHTHTHTHTHIRNSVFAAAVGGSEEGCRSGRLAVAAAGEGGMCSLTTEYVLLLLNVFSCYSALQWPLPVKEVCVN